MDEQELQGVFNYAMSFKGNSEDEVASAKSILGLIAQGKATIDSGGRISSLSQGREEVEAIRSRIKEIRDGEFDERLREYAEDHQNFSVPFIPRYDPKWSYDLLIGNPSFCEACFYSVLDKPEAVEGLRNGLVEKQKRAKEDLFDVLSAVEGRRSYSLFNKKQYEEGKVIELEGDELRVADKSYLRDTMVDLLEPIAGICLLEGNEEASRNALRRQFVLGNVVFAKYFLNQMEGTPRDCEERFETDLEYRGKAFRSGGWDPEDTDYHKKRLDDHLEIGTQELRTHIEKATDHYSSDIEGLRSEDVGEVFVARKK